MSKTPDFDPLRDARNVLTSPNLESSSKIQPKARGRTGTKIDSQARTSMAPRPGISVRATSHVRTSATGTEIAVRTMDSAKLFHRVVFSRNLTGDILSYPEFHNCAFSYMDVDRERLEVG